MTFTCVPKTAVLVTKKHEKKRRKGKKQKMKEEKQKGRKIEEPLENSGE